MKLSKCRWKDGCPWATNFKYEKRLFPYDDEPREKADFFELAAKGGFGIRDKRAYSDPRHFFVISIHPFYLVRGNHLEAT